MNQETQALLLGDYLRHKREEAGFTLEKLSHKTKISVNILKSLESNDFAHLPSAAYIKGFVMSYVKVLSLPSDEAIKIMESTYKAIQGKSFPALNHTKIFDAKRRSSSGGESADDLIHKSESIMDNTKSFLPIIVFGCVIVFVFGGYKFISNIIDHETENLNKKDLGPKIESSSALVRPAAKPVIQEKKPADETKPAQAVATVPAKEAVSAISVPAQPANGDFQRNFPKVEFKKITGTLFEVKPNAPEADNKELLPDDVKAKVKADLQNVYVKAVDGNTWVSYKVDSKPIESVIISKGSGRFIQGEEIRLFLGNVMVTKIFYNNNLISTPTPSGVKSLVFPEASSTKYSLPLFPKAKDDILYTSEEYQKRMKLEEDELAKRQVPTT